MADEKKNPLGPTGERVRQNLKRIREAKRLTFVELSDRLSKTGRPIPVLGLRRIERGERRVDADDLAALAVVLNVGVGAFLLPPEASDEQIALTPECSVSSRTAWRWIEGQGPAMDWDPGEGVSPADPGADPAIAAEAYEREQEYIRRRAEYMSQTLPPELRRAAEQPSVRLAHQLVELIEDLLSPEPGKDSVTEAARVRMTMRRYQQLGIELDELQERFAPKPIVHPGEQYQRNTERLKDLDGDSGETGPDDQGGGE